MTKFSTATSRRWNYGTPHFDVVVDPSLDAASTVGASRYLSGEGRPARFPRSNRFKVARPDNFEQTGSMVQAIAGSKCGALNPRRLTVDPSPSPRGGSTVLLARATVPLLNERRGH